MKTQDYDQQMASDIIASFGARPEMLVQLLGAFVELLVSKDPEIQ